MTSIEYKEIVKNTLSEYRYLHSLAVADLASNLAKAHGINEDKAYLAGLLHDLTKEKIESFHDELFIKYQDLDKLQESVKVKHSHSCPYFLYETYKIQDRELLEAIYNHTICNSELSLSKIIYIADKREARRNIKDDVVEIALKDLDAGYKHCKEIDLKYLKSKGVIHE